MLEKEKAIQIIREEYQNGFSPTDIAQNMSQQLGAPFDLVYRFVMKTLGEEVEGSAPQAAAEPIPALSPTAAYEVDASPIPGHETIQEEEPVEQAEGTAVEPSQSPSFTIAAGPDLKALEQNPKVEKFVLQLLMSERKTSDAVLAVCERTGLGWEEAQRLVARIAAKNHKSLKSKRNRLPIILSAIALVAGGLLAFAGISEAYTIYTSVQGMETAEEMVMATAGQEFLRSAIWSLATGGVLLLGGATGLFIAMRAQFE